jgi:hypothetical protein
MIIEEFTLNPVNIKAVKFDGDNGRELALWCGGELIVESYLPKPQQRPHILIKARVGDLWAGVGDWIVRGIHGEHFPVPAPIFQLLVEKVEQ